MGWFWCPKCDQARHLDDNVTPNVCWKCRTPETKGIYPWPDESGKRPTKGKQE